MIKHVKPAESLSGEINPPADKSISQRAAIFALLHEGHSEIRNYSSAHDPQTTLRCISELGAQINVNNHVISIKGTGRFGLKTPAHDLDCGNSGTAMRLIAGVLAGAGISAKLVGDTSLSKRTMRRIIDPLEEMGAHVLARNGEYPPLFINRNDALKAIKFELPIPSAQLKSCILLAGLFSEKPTTVIEKLPSRDHTERLLGLKVDGDFPSRKIHVSSSDEIPNQSYTIPGDFSAAAFWMVAGVIHPNADFILKNIGLNPTRNALLPLLKEMGADISIENAHKEGAEPVGDILIKSSQLKAIKTDPSIIPNCIDELPVLAVAMLFAEGTSEISGAGELRHKETDRIKAVSEMLKAVGANFKEKEDGFIIHGNPDFKFRSADFKSYHDHRIAMAAAVLALKGNEKSTIDGAECAAVSYPDFWEDLKKLSR